VPATINVSDPFGDRDERAGTGQDRAHRHRQDRRQPMADPSASPGIGHRRQNRQHRGTVGIDRPNSSEQVTERGMYGAAGMVPLVIRQV
jgi:hypothetical protein